MLSYIATAQTAALLEAASSATASAMLDSYSPVLVDTGSRGEQGGRRRPCLTSVKIHTPIVLSVSDPSKQRQPSRQGLPLTCDVDLVAGEILLLSPYSPGSDRPGIRHHADIGKQHEGAFRGDEKHSIRPVVHMTAHASSALDESVSGIAAPPSKSLKVSGSSGARRNFASLCLIVGRAAEAAGRPLPLPAACASLCRLNADWDAFAFDPAAVDCSFQLAAACDGGLASIPAVASTITSPSLRQQLAVPVSAECVASVASGYRRDTGISPEGAGSRSTVASLQGGMNLCGDSEASLSSDAMPSWFAAAQLSGAGDRRGSLGIEARLMSASGADGSNGGVHVAGLATKPLGSHLPSRGPADAKTMPPLPDVEQGRRSMEQKRSNLYEVVLQAAIPHAILPDLESPSLPFLQLFSAIHASECTASDSTASCIAMEMAVLQAAGGAHILAAVTPEGVTASAGGPPQWAAAKNIVSGALRGLFKAADSELLPRGQMRLRSYDPKDKSSGTYGAIAACPSTGLGNRFFLSKTKSGHQPYPIDTTLSAVQYFPTLLPRFMTESSAATDFRLVPRPAGSLSSLVPESVPKAQPGQVSVKVQAVGLNFRDLLVVSC